MAFFLLLAATLAPLRAQTPSPPLVVMVGWDGADYRRVSQLVRAHELPHLARLAAGGSFEELEIVSLTETRPSWAEQLGEPWTVSGVESNSVFRPLPEQRTVFGWLKLAGIPSAFVSGKCPGMLCQRGHHDLEGTQFQNVPRATVFFAQNHNWTMPEVTDQCRQAVAAVGRGGFVFCHYQWPDSVGHKFGGDSPEYDQALRNLDTELGRLRAHLPPGAVVLVTSDHGFERAGDPKEPDYRPPPSPIERKYPFGYSHLRSPHALLASNLRLASRAINRDISPTLYALFGVPRPPWLLEGRSVLLETSLSSVASAHAARPPGGHNSATPSHKPPTRG